MTRPEIEYPTPLYMQLWLVGVTAIVGLVVLLTVVLR